MKKYMVILVCLLLTAVLLTACGGKGDVTSANTTTDPAGTTTGEKQPAIIADNGNTSFVIRCDDPKLSAFALTVRSMILGECGVAPEMADRDTDIILIGSQSNPVAAALADTCAELTISSDTAIYALYYQDGVLALYANHEEGYARLVLLLETFITDGVMQIPVEDVIYDTFSISEYEEELEKQKEEEEEQKRLEEERKRQEVIDKLVAENGQFDSADFGTVTDLESSYSVPGVVPARGEKKLLLTDQNIDTVKANLTAAQNRYAYQKYLELSETDCTGILPAATDAEKGNFSSKILGIIEAKAFRYAMTDDEVYGYEAIIAMKNYLLSLDIYDDFPDKYRAYGQTMLVTGMVYDWCNDLLEPADKEQLVAGAQNRLMTYMQVGFPPDRMGSVVGHGSEAQILRDYLGFSIAVYDDYPAYYEFVMGRIEDEYVPARNYFYASGSYWQGGGYGPYRFSYDLLGACIYRNMTGGAYDLYNMEDMERCSLTYIHYMRPDGQLLRVGDDINEGGSSYSLNPHSVMLFYSSVLFDNPVFKEYAKEELKDFTRFFDYNYALTPVYFLILNDPTVSGDTESELPLVNYNGSPLGSYIARTEWGPDGAMTYTKIGEGFTANHEHRDAGSFQVYYKGILASDSGYYDRYGSPHHYGYAKQSVSSNTMQVYDPEKEGNGLWEYSGGQSIENGAHDEHNTLEDWLESSVSHQATVLANGSQVAEDGSLLYAYIAGDLTGAYDADVVDYYSRHMLTIATGNPEMPLLFITFDRVDAVKAESEKNYLLHVQQEPLATDSDNVMIVVNTKDGNNGRMVVQSLTDTRMYTIGGDGQEYWLYDKNVPTEKEIGPVCEAGWGRINITPLDKQESDCFLVVMYVSDAVKEGENAVDVSYIPAQKIDGDSVLGSVILGTVVTFQKGTERQDQAFSFTVPQDGEYASMRYYVTGVAGGQYRVLVDGAEVGVFTATEEEGMLSFTAPAGEVSVIPQQGHLVYETNGGASVSGLPATFGTEGLVLPTDLTYAGRRFIGWYTTPDFEQGTEMTAIAPGTTGTVTLYAAWEKEYDQLTYETNGGIFSGSYPERHVDGTAVQLPTNITRTGFVFLGWYTDAGWSPESRMEMVPAGHDGNLTLYAKWGSEETLAEEQEPVLFGTDNTFSKVYPFAAMAQDYLKLDLTLKLTQGHKPFRATVSLGTLVSPNGLPVRAGVDLLEITADGEVLLFGQNEVVLTILTAKESRVTVYADVSRINSGAVIAYAFVDGEPVTALQYSVPEGTAQAIGAVRNLDRVFITGRSNADTAGFTLCSFTAETAYDLDILADHAMLPAVGTFVKHIMDIPTQKLENTTSPDAPISIEHKLPDYYQTKDDTIIRQEIEITFLLRQVGDFTQSILRFRTAEGWTENNIFGVKKTGEIYIGESERNSVAIGQITGDEQKVVIRITMEKTADGGMQYIVRGKVGDGEEQTYYYPIQMPTANKMTFNSGTNRDPVSLQYRVYLSDGYTMVTDFSFYSTGTYHQTP